MTGASFPTWAAPAAATPKAPGFDGAYRVALTAPYHSSRQTYVYVMLADDTKHAPKPAYSTANGYVRYPPDDDSDTFLYSQSRYSIYGNADKGLYFDTATNTCIRD